MSTFFVSEDSSTVPLQVFGHASDVSLCLVHYIPAQLADITFDAVGHDLQVRRTVDQVMRIYTGVTLEVKVLQTCQEVTITIEDPALRDQAMESIRTVDLLFVMFDIVERRDGLVD
ncbi:hypothetical protein TRAPUB_14114 [Trametes pubescens]|uniref:Uncharacterized protein n=1 Tax=Trametes pubescens TaxID=154538 RepID=A0A1M2VP79_TRAPU|nr:hypothetical protein TRAPUB_14114 [Trametes pubescens]